MHATIATTKINNNAIRAQASKEVELKGHTNTVDQVCWDKTHPDRLATASTDKTIRLWDARAPSKSPQIIETSGENINITWSPCGNYIAFGNKDDWLAVADARKGKATTKVKFNSEVNEFIFNKTSDLLFVTTGQSDKGTVEIVKFPSLKSHTSILAHTGTCLCIGATSDYRYFAVGGADALVSLWDYNEWACVRTFGRLDWPVRTLSFTHEGSVIASGSEDSFIDLVWRLTCAMLR